MSILRASITTKYTFYSASLYLYYINPRGRSINQNKVCFIAYIFHSIKYTPKLVTWIRVRNFQFSLFTYIPIFGVISPPTTIFLQQTAPQVLKTKFFFVSLVSLDTPPTTIFLQQTAPQMLKTKYFFVSLCVICTNVKWNLLPTY